MIGLIHEQHFSTSSIDKCRSTLDTWFECAIRCKRYIAWPLNEGVYFGVHSIAGQAVIFNTTILIAAVKHAFRIAIVTSRQDIASALVYQHASDLLVNTSRPLRDCRSYLDIILVTGDPHDIFPWLQRPLCIKQYGPIIENSSGNQSRHIVCIAAANICIS